MCLFSKNEHFQALNEFSEPFPESASHNNSRLLCRLFVILKVFFANSVDPDQTAPLGAV